MGADLHALLEQVTVTEIDAYVCDFNKGKLKGLLGWWSVEDDEGTIGYSRQKPTHFGTACQ